MEVLPIMFNRNSFSIFMILALLLGSGLFFSNQTTSQVSADADYQVFGPNDAETEAVEEYLNDFGHWLCHLVPDFRNENGIPDRNIQAVFGNPRLDNSTHEVNLRIFPNHDGVSSEANCPSNFTTMLILQGTTVDITSYEFLVDGVTVDVSEGGIKATYLTSHTYNTAHGLANILTIEWTDRPSAFQTVSVSGPVPVLGIVDENPYLEGYVEYTEVIMSEADATSLMAQLDCVLYASELANAANDVYMWRDGDCNNPIVVTSLAIPNVNGASLIGEPQIVWNADGSFAEYQAYSLHIENLVADNWNIIPFYATDAQLIGLVADQATTARFMQQTYRSLGRSFTTCGDANIQFAGIGNGSFAVWSNGIFKGNVTLGNLITVTEGGDEPLLIPHNLLGSSAPVVSGENNFHAELMQDGVTLQWVSSNFFQFTAQLRPELCG